MSGFAWLLQFHFVASGAVPKSCVSLNLRSFGSTLSCCPKLTKWIVVYGYLMFCITSSAYTGLVWFVILFCWMDGLWHWNTWWFCSPSMMVAFDSHPWMVKLWIQTEKFEHLVMECERD